MIVTVIGAGERAGKSALAVHLAMLRIQDRHLAILIDADPQKHSFLWSVRRNGAGMKLHLPLLPAMDIDLYSELEKLDSRYRDIVIDAGAMEDDDAKTAVVAARVAVVPVQAQAQSRALEAALLWRIEMLRVFNPAMRILIVPVRGADADTAQAGSTTQPLAASHPSATVAAVIHDSEEQRDAFRHGLTVFETRADHAGAVMEMEKLGREVYGDSRRGGIAEDIKAIRAALASLQMLRRGEVRNSTRL